jgi:hypothetical protein
MAVPATQSARLRSPASAGVARSEAVEPVAPEHPVLSAQRVLGNRVIHRQLRSGSLPPELLLGQPAALSNQAVQRLIRHRTRRRGRDEGWSDRAAQPIGSPGAGDLARSAAGADSASVVHRQGDAGRGPADAGAPAGAGPITTPVPAGGQSGPAAGGKAGPELRQGPIGDIVIHLDKWTLHKQETYGKGWEKDVGGSLTLPIPIPEPPMTVEVGATGRAFARFEGTYGPIQLRNIQIGISSSQALKLGTALVIGGAAGFMTGAYLGEFRGLAQFALPTNLRLQLGVEGGLSAEAKAGGAFSVADIEAGLRAAATLDAGMTFFDEQISLYYADRQLRFHTNPKTKKTIQLKLDLDAFIRARLLKGTLGWTWQKAWSLGVTPLGEAWDVNAELDLAYNSASGVKPTISIKEEDLIAVKNNLKKLFDAAKSPSQVTPQGQGGVGGAGGKAPTGKTREDPIEMVWFKRPIDYPKYIYLDTNNAKNDRFMIHGKKELPGAGYDIGVDWGFFPVERGEPMKKQTPGSRSTQQKFRKDLELYGAYNWDAKQHEAEHIRDLAWGGPDAIGNLWPMDAGQNRAAGPEQNQNQMVEWRPDENSPPIRTPIGDYRLLGRWFIIKQVRSI